MTFKIETTIPDAGVTSSTRLCCYLRTGELGITNKTSSSWQEVRANNIQDAEVMWEKFIALRAPAEIKAVPNYVKVR